MAKRRCEKEYSDGERGPPDGGYGWFCVLGSYLNHFILGGFERSVGLLYLRLDNDFEGQSASSLSLVFSMKTAIRLCLGPVVGMLCERFGCRLVVVTGGIIACAGLLLSAFPPELPFLYFSYGTLTGVGFAMSYTPSIVIVGWYFSRHQGKSVGIAVSGYGVGAFCIPLLVEAALSYFGYSGTMLILAGIGLNMTVGGALFRPLKNRFGKRNELELSAGEISSHFDKTENACTQTLFQNEVEADRQSQRFAIHTQQQIQEEKDPRNVKSCRRHLDLALLLDLPFLSFCIGTFLFSFASQASLVFLSPLAQNRGLSQHEIALIMSVTGGVDSVACILAGVLFDFSKVVPIRLYVYSLDVLFLAVITLLCTFARSFPAFMVIGACYGIGVGMFTSQKSVMIMDLVGQEVLSSAFGLLILFQGMGSLLGPPVSGAIRDKFGKYDLTFYFGSAIFLVAMLMMVVPKFVARRRERHRVRGP